MPIRSSVCTYSPSSVTDSKYSSALSAANLLSVRNYKSPSATYAAKSVAKGRGSSDYRASNRYSASSSSYSPSLLATSSDSGSSYSSPISSALNYASTTGSYRPLRSTGSALSNSIRHDGNTLSTSTGISYSRYSSASSLASGASYLDRPNSLASLHTHLPSSSALSKRQSYTSTSSCETLPSEVPRGLINLGNTCYMNAVIQSLYSVESFRNLILRASCTSNLCSEELSNLFREMKRSSGPVSPTGFKHTFSRRQSKFLGLGQQDAQEFLRYLINELHEELNHPHRSGISRTPKTSDEAWSLYRDRVDDSPLVDLLVGQMCSTIVCSVCQHKSHCWDPFWDLSLPLVPGRRSCSLEDVIQDFTARETLDSNEKPICSSCKTATRSTKQISLCRLPQLLILHLKKFTNDGFKMTIPDVRIVESLTFNGTTFSLLACISHHGHSSSSGHYTCHCKYSSRWYHFNDDRVRDVTSAFHGDKLTDAYVLFYTQSPDADILAHSKL